MVGAAAYDLASDEEILYFMSYPFPLFDFTGVFDRFFPFLLFCVPAVSLLLDFVSIIFDSSFSVSGGVPYKFDKF